MEEGSNVINNAIGHQLPQAIIAMPRVVIPTVPTGPATGVALRAATAAGGRFQLMT